MLGPGARGKGEAASPEAEAARRAAGFLGTQDATRDNGVALPGPGGRAGPAGAGQLAAAARDLQVALEEIGMKARQTRTGKGSADEAAGDTTAFSQLDSARASWSRPEGPARLEAATSRATPMELEGVDRMHRLLVGQGSAGAEARLTITDGPLAGAHIHLRTGPGGLQAAVSLSSESSRQTLLTAMDEVARRMRDKGHKLTVRMGPFTPSPPDHSPRQQEPG
jgi:hypothetical protein